MPNYRYVARDERGHAVSGTLAAQNSEALADQLKRMGYLVTQAREVAEGVAIESALQRWRRVGTDDLVLFNVQLAKMIQVGIPLVSSLHTLSEQTENARLRAAVSEVARAVEAGSGFSEALKRHPSIFSPLFINMVRAGEVSGKLDEILRRLAVFSKREAELEQQVKTAMTYPALLLVVGLGVIVLLLAGVIPKFITIFMEANVPLPLPTHILHLASEALRRHWLPLGAGLAAAAAGARMYAGSPAGRRQVDAIGIRLPVVGDLVRKTAVARLTRTLETLFASGVPVLEALSIAEQTCGNAVIADVCRSVQGSVKEGGTLSEPMRISREFPPMVVQMVSVGETSGTLDHMLGEIAEHYDELLRHRLKRLTALIEPAFLLIMGGLVAFIMASVLLPMFRMVNVIR
jgi:type IV pilus assembly protein PilC